VMVGHERKKIFSHEPFSDLAWEERSAVAPPVSPEGGVNRVRSLT